MLRNLNVKFLWTVISSSSNFELEFENVYELNK